MPIDKSPTLIRHEHESFLIPGEVAVAIATRRPGMVQLLTGRLKKSLEERATEIAAGVEPQNAGEVEQLPPEQVVDLLRLLQATLERVEQLDDDLEEANRKRTFFEQSLEDLRQKVCDIQLDADHA